LPIQELAMSQTTRRRFLKNASLAAAGVTLAGTAFNKALGANDAIRVGIAGLNGRGQSHLADLAKIPGVEITYLIDPDQKVLERSVKTVVSLTSRAPQAVQDVRQALDDKELDVVTVATPNHWHSLITIWACEAGKDVYVEKPCSHNVHEGRIALDMARRKNRIVQHGTQSRSDIDWAGAINFIKSGQAGKLQVARGLVYKRRDSIGFKQAESPPDSLDFNLWLGPAPEQPFHRNLVHYNWHWFWDTGNGDIGNQGVHQMDIARWGIDGATFPKGVVSFGGRFGYEDQGQTPNTQIALFDYGSAQLIFEVRGLPTESYPHAGLQGDNVFHCEGGLVTRKHFYPKGSSQPEAIPSAPVGPGGSHFANFISAVRSRNQSELNADIQEGHYSSALCHLANISYRLADKVPFNPQTKAFGDNKEAYETLERTQQHLSANDLKLDGESYMLGRKLAFDAKNERFDGDHEANRLLTRQYRAPFVVPEKVA
jgi:predicted dehydrogenase